VTTGKRIKFLGKIHVSKFKLTMTVIFNVWALNLLIAEEQKCFPILL